MGAAVKQNGKNVTAIQGDVSKLSALDSLFAQIKSERGRLDILFANAGITTNKSAKVVEVVRNRALDHEG